ncbi:MAG: glucose-1-phosphate adenylyltransferase [Deinococcus sp.]|nr:glucose-1-phosphate adenylyltransferase [Deinococcus sp.]
MPHRVLAMILAGGKGQRLYPLTQARAKPAVPFGGKYRIIDFVLNNFINSEIYSIYVLTQFKSQSLTEHIQRHWRLGSYLSDYFITLAPAQMRMGDRWYEGTADAIYQNLHLVERSDKDTIAVFGGDHIFKMDIRQMVKLHRERDADVTVACMPTPIGEAHRFGVMAVDEEWWVQGFEEKPVHPQPIPGQPHMALVSMGNYLFKRDMLLQLLEEDAQNPNSTHDFGKDILPGNLHKVKLCAYDFRRNQIPGTELGAANDYWRDVGTIDAYWEANMDLVYVTPALNLYNTAWPLRCANLFDPPGKFVHEAGDRVGRAMNSLVSDGCIVSGGLVRESVLGPRVHVHSYAEVYRSVIMEDCDIGEGARIQRAILDKEVRVPPGEQIGYDREKDLRRGFTMSEGGITVVPKGFRFR